MLLLFCSFSFLKANELPETYTINKYLHSKVKVIITDTNNNPISGVEVIVIQSTNQLGKAKTNEMGEAIITCTHSEENAQVTIDIYKKDYQKISISAEIHTPITSFAFILKKSDENTKDVKLDILMEDKEVFKDKSDK